MFALPNAMPSALFSSFSCPPAPAVAVTGAAEVVHLGYGALAQRLVVAVPARAADTTRARSRGLSFVAAVASPRSDESHARDEQQHHRQHHHIWMVNVHLGTSNPRAAGARLTAWLDAHLREACELHALPTAIILAGPHLETCPPLRDWGAVSCATDVHVGCADVLAKATAPGASVRPLASHDTSSSDAHQVAVPPPGLVVMLEFRDTPHEAGQQQ